MDVGPAARKLNFRIGNMEVNAKCTVTDSSFGLNMVFLNLFLLN